MGNKTKINIDNFFKYISKPLSLESLEMIYNTNNVVFERVDLYISFILTLNRIIIDTYLGDEFTNNLDQLNHFNWCWNKTSELLNYHNIQFTNNKTAKEYFTNFYFNTFYSNDKTNDIKNISKTWEDIFNYNIEKTQSDLDSFLTLYKILEKSYKKQ